MQTKQAPDLECSPVRLLASYVDEFERWMRSSGRCRKSHDAEDICQEIRLAFWELRDTPATPAEARLTFLRLASRFAMRSKRQVYRQGALVHDPEQFAEQRERNAVQSLALFDALEQLDEEQRWIIIECKLKERSNVEVGNDLGVSDDVVRYRLWRAMTQLLGILKDKDEHTSGKKEERGAIIAPLAFVFTDDQCGAFWAIWSAERRLPTYGGGPPGPPPNPTRPFRWIPRFSFPHRPNYIAAIGGGVGVLAGLGALLFFLFESPNATPVMARLGVRDHFLAAAFGDTSTPEYPSAFTKEESSSRPNPKTPSDDSSGIAKSTPQSSRSSAATSSSPPVDPEELRRARRRRPHFFPSRK